MVKIKLTNGLEIRCPINHPKREGKNLVIPMAMKACRIIQGGKCINTVYDISLDDILGNEVLRGFYGGKFSEQVIPVKEIKNITIINDDLVEINV